MEEFLDRIMLLGAESEFTNNEDVIAANRAEAVELYMKEFRTLGSRAVTFTSDVTRVEVIDEKGRSYVNKGIDKVELSIQDEFRTLKVFISKDKTKSKSDLEVGNTFQELGFDGIIRILESSSASIRVRYESPVLTYEDEMSVDTFVIGFDLGTFHSLVKF